MKERKSFLVYFDWGEPFERLDDEALGKLFRGMFRYAQNGELPEFDDPTLSIIFSFVKTALERDKATYEERCRKNSEAGKKSAEAKSKPLGSPLPPHDFAGLLKTLN